MPVLTNISIVVMLLLQWCLSYGQSNPVKFILGNYTPQKKQNEVSFRCSPRFNQLNQKLNGVLSANWKWPKTGPIESIWVTETGTYFEIDSEGNIDNFNLKTKSLLTIDGKYWENSISSNNLISLGNISIKKSQEKKVKWLQFYPTVGDVNTINKYENLEYLILAGNIPIIQKLTDNKLYMNSYYSNLGVPMFGSHFLEKLNKLKYLEIQDMNNNGNNKGYSEHRNEFLLLGGLPSNVLQLPKLTMLKLTDSDFLPVEFHDFEKFTYLDFTMQNHSKPELMNLALIMNFYGKDQNTGNWKKYLETVRIDPSFSIPQNGTYTSYYKNGELLCKGNFVNGLPDGEWCFWFENGNVSQQRTYHLGVKTGEWLFMSDSLMYGGYNIRDTILTFHFKNDTLLRRVEKRIHSFSEESGCYDYHGFFYDLAKSTSVYDFYWSGSILNHVQHNYMNQGFGQKHPPSASWKGPDTLNGYHETWYLSDSAWQYNYSNFTTICPDDDREIQYNASGSNGELASYTSCKEKADWSFNDQFFYFSEVDFNTGFARYIEYERTQENGEYHEIKRKEVKIEEILPKVFNGNK